MNQHYIWERLEHKMFCLHSPLNWVRADCPGAGWLEHRAHAKVHLLFLCFAAGSSVGPSSEWRLGHSPQGFYERKGVLASYTLRHPARWYGLLFVSYSLSLEKYFSKVFTGTRNANRWFVKHIVKICIYDVYNYVYASIFRIFFFFGILKGLLITKS